MVRQSRKSKPPELQSDGRICASRPQPSYSGSLRWAENLTNKLAAWLTPADRTLFLKEILTFRETARSFRIALCYTASIINVEDSPLASGRWFSEFDDEHRSSVVVLCSDTKDELFGNEAPLDKEVNIEGRLFRVIGTLGKIQSVYNAGKDPINNRVMFPLRTFKALHYPSLKPEQRKTA